jgi:hypothetical protein
MVFGYGEVEILTTMKPSNNLKIESLGEGWCDKDHIILHACFQLLCDFVEKEMRLNTFVDWNTDHQSRHAKKEIEELYEWWQSKKNENAESAEAFREDIKIYYKENQMLKRLIDVRMHLWT